jgi:hypothetical protein
VHLWLSRLPQGQAADCKAAKGCLTTIFLFPVVKNPVVRVELFCVVAHLLHAVKAHATLFTDVLFVFVRHLLVLHKFLDLAELFAALFALMLCKK